ncbi:MAG TPA: XdhC/CoxI family protein [Dongiaceae bacterium]|nr:XdhC/CoxI family protein [Dongiaceae bacterium]
MDVFQEICNLQRQGRRSALATIVNVRGSIPSAKAAKMLVRDDGTIVGTIGGGCVENEVREGAAQVMNDEKPRTYEFNLNQHPDDDSGLICGGSLQVFVEPVIPAPLLYIFGAGHLGLNIYKVALLAGFQPIVIDDRDLYANRERFPEALDVLAGDIDQILAHLDPPGTSYIAIVTRGHQHDLRVLRWAVETRAQYIGMIGSGRKVLTLYDQLENEGISRALLDKVYAPIGLQIGSVTPEEIAVSVVAELIGIRRHAEVPLPHSRNRIRKSERAGVGPA